MVPIVWTFRQPKPLSGRQSLSRVRLRHETLRGRLKVQLRYVSFFTGAGGLDLGLEQAGWECLFANEADRVACRTLKQNRPTLNLFEGDVRSLSVEDVRISLLSVGEESKPEAVVGGPPCQAFSTAGKRLGLNDERGNVFLHFLELAIGLCPRVIIVENVRGLLSAPLKHRPHAERGFGFEPLSPEELRGGALEFISRRLRQAGYGVSFDLYDTANFGVPQRRERLVLIATERARRAPHLQPTHHAPKDPGAGARWETFADAVTGLHHHHFVPLRPKQRRFLELLKSGQNWRSLPDSLQREAMGAAFECGGGRTGFYRRLAWDEPAPTLLTSPTMPATLLGHPVELRPLSVEEYARLQTFPDDWVFAGTLLERYRQIGNAVPVRFARCIGEQVSSYLQNGSGANGKSTSVRSRYKDTSDRTWKSPPIELASPRDV